MLPGQHPAMILPGSAQYDNWSGVFTRVTAFILSGEMAVAYFMVHFPKGFFPMMMGGNNGEIAVLYCFVFLYLAAAGGGPWSLDRVLRRG